MFKGRFAEEEFDDIVYVSDLTKIEDALFQLNITGQPLLITGPGPTKHIGEQIKKEMNHHKLVGRLESREASWSEAKRIASEAERLGADVLFCACAGSGIISPKLSTNLIDIPLVYVPTSVASDGIDSTLVSFKENGIPKSVIVPPYLKIISKETLLDAPPNHARGGDISAKISSVDDWEYATRTGNEKKTLFDEEDGKTLKKYAFTVLIDHSSIIDSKTPLSRKHLMYERLVYDVLEGSIIAGRIGSKYGSSRPLSGSEHLIDSAIQLIYEKMGERSPILHEEGVAFGTVVSLSLYDNEYSKPYSTSLLNLLKNIYNNFVNIPDYVKIASGPLAKEIGRVRGRYTKLEKFDLNENSFYETLVRNGLVRPNSLKYPLNDFSLSNLQSQRAIINAKPESRYI